MSELLSAVCCTLMILAFAQVIVEAVLPEGGTRRFVVFIMGLITVAVIAGFLVDGSRALRGATASGLLRVPNARQQEEQPAAEAAGKNPYENYIQKLIDQWK